MKKLEFKKIFPYIFSSVTVLTLFFTSYDTALSAPARNFKDLVTNTIIGDILNPTVLLLIALAIIFFLWGVFKFMIAEGDKKEDGKQFMLWGIVGIFVMVSVWGLVSILASTFKLETSRTLEIPSAL